MPIYVYRCADCDAHLEKRQGFADAPLTACEVCGGTLRRVLQPVGIIFKGSGFYTTDYRNSASGNGKSSTAGNGTDGTPSKAASGSGEKTAGASTATSES
ncbi:MAG TPA: FmdB family zinc ribbon protein [Chloroflexota bacterium]|nr:FmdB family zinc ribbon protein [Chloroflexota bacterium]